MKIYIDLIIFINLFFDFLLLFSVNIILKRNTRVYRLILGAVFGGVSILSLFYSFNNITLFLFKFFISIIMILISFSYKSFKYFINNFIYLYIVSIMLGGFLYFINNSFSYKNVGLIFINNGFSINIILIIILTPIIILIYILNTKKIKDINTNNYVVSITLLNNKKLELTGFLDTGNNLYDPYKKRPIIVLNKELIKDYKPNYLLVPCITVNKNELIKCFKIKEIVINGKKIKKECLVALSDNNFNVLGVDLLLHKRLIKEIKL